MSAQSPLVSVLITTYNREKYVQSAIESVLNSTYQNLELIISDDNSQDQTFDIAKKIAEKDSRIKIYRNDKNLGDYGNRNKAASYAKGKYLKYVDSDDYIYPWGLEILVNTMEKYPEAGWGLCSLIQIPDRPYPFILGSKEAYEYHYFNIGIFHKAPLSSIIKKDVFDKVGGFNNINMAGDFDMWHRLALYYPVVLMQDGLVWYREHQDQESKQYRKYLLKYESIIQQYLNHINCPLNINQCKLIQKRRTLQFFKTCIGSLVRFRLLNGWDNMKLTLYNFRKMI